MLIYIRDADGNNLGSGPITSASQWESTAALDGAGAWRFTCLAADTAGTLVATGNRAHCYELVNGTMQEVGAGIIETVERRLTPEGVIVEVGGDDLLRELTYTSVGFLNILDTESQDPLKVTLDYDDGGVWQTADMPELYNNVTDDYYDIATLESDQYIYAGGSSTLSGLYWLAGTIYVNTNAGTLSVQYYNGADWIDVENLWDGTYNWSATLNQTGWITWDRPDDHQMTTHDGTSAYWVRLQPSANTTHMQPREVDVLGDCPSDDALATLMALDADWSLDTTNGYAATGTAVYHQFGGESLLAALERVATTTGEHFRLGTGRQVVWLQDDHADSLCYLVPADAGGGVATEDDPYRCLIESLRVRDDAYELCTRVYPYGRGAGSTRTTIALASESPEAPYTKNAAGNYVQSPAGTALYGLRERVLEFPDIGPVEDGDLHAVEGANALLRAAEKWLKVHDTPTVAYEATVVSGGLGILPGTTVKVLAKEWYNGTEVVDLSQDTLVCLERSITIDEGGVRVTRLVLATKAEWAKTAARLVAEQVQDFRRYRATGSGGTTTVVSGGGTGGDGLDEAEVEALIASHAALPTVHQALVTAADSSLNVSGQALNVALRTDPGLLVSSGLGLGTPGTVVAGSASSVSGSAHNHAVSTGTPGTVTLSANAQGSATSLARSDHHHTLSQSIAPTWTGLHQHNANVTMGTLTSIKSDHWVSGSRGWSISHEGAGDFQVLTAKELVVKSFIADLEQALAGSQLITKSVVLLYADFVIPDYLATTTIEVEPLPGFPSADVFAAGEYLRVRYVGRGDGLEVTDCYLQVVAQTAKNDYRQIYSVTRLANTGTPPAGGAATPGNTVYAGAVVLDYGTSGDGYWHVTALDQNYGPYAEVATWETLPTNATVQVRMGQLSGIFAEGDEWGLVAGDTATDNYLRASTAGLQIYVGDGSHVFDEYGMTIHEGGSTFIYRWYDTKDTLVSDDYMTETGSLSIYRTMRVRDDGYSHVGMEMRADDAATNKAYALLDLDSVSAQLYGGTLTLGYTDHSETSYTQDRLMIAKNVGVRVYYDGLAVGDGVSCADDGYVKVLHAVVPTATLTGRIGGSAAVWDEGWFGTLHATTVSYTTVTTEEQVITGDLNAGDGVLFVDADLARVGINDLTPSQALDVTGGGRFTDVLYASGGLSVSGNITVSGTVDGVDVGTLKTTYDAHAHAAGDPTQVSHANLSGVSANQHHNQSHVLSGADHTASGLTVGQVLRAAGTSSFAWAQLAHSDLGSVSADQHHNQSHTLSGSDHTASGLTAGQVVRASGASTFAWAQLQHSDLGSVTADQHHNQSHVLAGSDHTASGLTAGHVLRASGATTFAWAEAQHNDLGGVTASQHHNPVTVGNTGLSLSTQEVSLNLGTDPGLVISAGLTLGTPSGLTAATANAVSGTGHTHTVATGTPGTIQPDDAASVGTSTDLARADHRHAIAAATAGSVSLAANAEGTATSFARSDHHHQLDQTIAPIWTGAHTFQATATMRDVLPELTDTYDLGSYQRWWRQQFVSQINAVVFVEATAQLLGGYLIVGHDQGTFPTEVASADTTIDFGEAQTTGDILVVRSHTGSGNVGVEYMSIDSLDSGTTYNVTRDLAGIYILSKPVWPQGTPYLILGQDMDGRIELNAYDTPRLSMILQGATYNAQAEVVRIGDLNGDWGYGVETYGAAFGEYAADQANLTVDPTNGLRMRTYNADRVTLSPAGVLAIRDSAGSAVFTFDASAGAEITKKLTMPGTESAIAIGATPPTSASTGTGIWVDRTGMYGLASSVLQAKFDATTGQITAAGGHVTIDEDGISISLPTLGDWHTQQAIKWHRSGFNQVLIGPYYTESGGSPTGHYLDIGLDNTLPKNIRIGSFDTVEAPRNLWSGLTLDCDGGTATFTHNLVVGGGTAYFGDDSSAPILYRSAGLTLRTANEFEVGGALTVGYGQTVRSYNAGGSTDNWMWPRWTDGYMYTNFGTAGWRIRTHGSGAVLTFDADGDATFARTVTATLGFSGAGVTSGADPGHTHTAYALTANGVTNGNSHDHVGGDGATIDHGGLGGRGDDDHTQYLLASGARALTANWDVGSYQVRALTFYADQATGTAPFTVASSTTVTNLSAYYLEGNRASAFVLRNGTTALTANWDVGSYQVRAQTFYSDQATGTAPFTVLSSTTVTNLSAYYLEGNRASAFATSGHTHTTLGAFTGSGQITLSYSGATYQANTTSGGADPALVLLENGTYKYGLCYTTAYDKFFIWSGPRATTIMEILDSGTDLRANTNWVDNAFDWVCAACGWYGASRPAGAECPTCGGTVEWHDDAELLHLAVHQPQGAALERMEKLGVLSRHEDGQVFMGLQTAHLFSWSAIAQLWERLEAAEARVAALERSA